MYICIAYQSILYKNKNSAYLKKWTIRLMFQAVKMCMVIPASSLLDFLHVNKL